VCVAGGTLVTGGVEGGLVVALVADAEADAWDEPEAWGEPDADAPPRPVAVAAGEELPGREAWPVGEGVRPPVCVPADDGLVCGVGVKIDGTDEPLPVQAETATATRTAPAAERPTVSHAPWAPPGMVRRIFMNPPRMRVR
jgi:hypothetical protein